MQAINSRDEYDYIVGELADEHAETVRRGRTDELTSAVVGSYSVADGSELAVDTTVSYLGDAVEVNGESRPLNPYDVIAYSSQNPEPSVPDHVEDTAAWDAARLLAKDVRERFAEP